MNNPFRLGSVIFLMAALLITLTSCATQMKLSSKDNAQEIQQAATRAPASDHSALDAWLSSLVGKYRMTGDHGCEDFQIVRQDSDPSFFYYVDFGPARTPRESLLMSDGSSLQIQTIDETTLAAHVETGFSMFNSPKQSIDFKLVKTPDGRLESLSIATRKGLSLFKEKISCD